MGSIDPERLFPPSDSGVRDLLAHLGIPLIRYERAISGIENMTLLVWSATSRYVLRIYPENQRSDSEIQRELDFMALLRARGLPVPEVIPTADGKPLLRAAYGGKQWQ